jgi:hypothetical protein
MTLSPDTALFHEGVALLKAFGQSLEGSKALWGAKGYQDAYANYLSYAINSINGMTPEVLRKVRCSIRPASVAANRETQGALERSAQQVAEQQKRWHDFMRRHAAVALRVLGDCNRTRKRRQGAKA